MALSIKHPQVDRLARDLASMTGESLTETVLVALRERLERQRARRSPLCLKDELMAIGRRCAVLPVLDDRNPEKILGYDDDGLAG